MKAIVDLVGNIKNKKLYEWVRRPISNRRRRYGPEKIVLFVPLRRRLLDRRAAVRVLAEQTERLQHRQAVGPERERFTWSPFGSTVPNQVRSSAPNAVAVLRSVSMILFYVYTMLFGVHRTNDEVVVAVVVCGNRTAEALVMIKSAIVFRGDSDLRIVVVAEKNIQQGFDETVSVLRNCCSVLGRFTVVICCTDFQLRDWKLLTNDSFSYEIHGITFPKEHADEWKKLFQPCASERLFLPVNISTTIKNTTVV